MRRILLCIMVLMLVWVPAAAQDFEVDPNANITWPPPIYLLSGQFDIRGSANLSNMTSYFIEFRPMNADFTPNETASWVPATLPRTVRVEDDVLGTWNTTVVPDGVYEVRMTIGVSNGSPVYVVVGPVRVENNPPPFAITPTPASLPTSAPTSPPVSIPTLVPTPTQVDLSPRAEIVVGANVRQGDSTFYPVVAGLVAGEEVAIVGISNTGSGWYQIEMANGRRGWIAPSVARTSGNLSNLPRVSPPPPPPPTATPTPVTQANIVITSVSLSVDPPRCDETFTVTARVQNTGTGPASSSGSVQVQDVYSGNGSVTATTQGSFPALNAGQFFDVVMRLTVDVYYQEAHRLTVVADSGAQILETNEGDNTFVRDYTLRRGNC
ncbi:MAG: hypothetical protein CL610_00775 [Anaerolineaceae bacterium]|nr:hypothetical protein [Anaerolineaceae bacterium]